jgi:hypothetical protein
MASHGMIDVPSLMTIDSAVQTILKVGLKILKGYSVGITDEGDV